MSLRLARFAAFMLLAAGFSATFSHMGSGRALRPQYDPRRLVCVVQVPSFAEQAKDAGQIFDVPPERLGEIAPSPDFDQGSYALLLGNSRDEAHRTILWTVLIVTVGFLAMLTLRLVRQGRRTSDGNPQPETSSEQNQ